MQPYTNEQIAEAVETYVDALTLDDLAAIVCNDLYEYYRKSANTEEVLEFLGAMLVEEEMCDE